MIPWPFHSPPFCRRLGLSVWIRPLFLLWYTLSSPQSRIVPTYYLLLPSLSGLFSSSMVWSPVVAGCCYCCQEFNLLLFGRSMVGCLHRIGLPVITMCRRSRRFLRSFFCSVWRGPRFVVVRSCRICDALCLVSTVIISFPLAWVFPGSSFSVWWSPWSRQLRLNGSNLGSFLS